MSKGQRGNKEAKKPKAGPAPAVPEAMAGVLPAGRSAASAPKPKKR
ncbi:MAG: hypothetical protein QE285_00450 [Aquabacterium sp.]|nr:hypothetical protein [Aquabacterium sp.]